MGPGDVDLGISPELTPPENHIIEYGYERPLGVVLLGQTGYGKTALLEHFIAEDIRQGTTAIVFDPHGELSERLLRIGAAIAPDKLLFCEISANLSYGFNPLEVKTPGDPLEESQTIDSLMQVFRKHWSDNPAYAFGSRVEWVLSNTARTILANPGYTLAEIPLLLSDKAFRDKLVRNVVNPQVQFFWGEYRQLESTRRPLDTWQMVESTVTRLIQFLANEWLYRVLYQAKGTIKFSQLIDSGKTVIFSLPIGKLGEEPAALLGSMLLGKLVTTVYARNEYGKTYPRLHVYIDEYSRFETPITANLLTQGRKFNVGTTITLQTLAQVPDEENRAAILQTGTLIAFQCIGADADTLSRQMPLPDPVSLMKPEPILLHSHSAVEDIWLKGHPNQAVMAVRQAYFWIVETLKNNPHQEYFIYDPTNLLREHPGWGREEVINDWQMYRSSADMLKEGIALLDQYYYNWMEHEYALGKPATPADMQLVLKIAQCLFGFFGWEMVMKPYMTRERQIYLAHRLQDYIDHIGERYFKFIPERFRDVPIHEEKDWALVQLQKEQQHVLVQLQNFRFSDRVDNPERVKQLALEIGIPPHEADQLIDWTILPHIDLSGVFSSGDPQTRELKDLLSDIPANIATDLPEELKDYALTTPGFRERFELAGYQARERAAFVKYGLRGCGFILEKEPVFDTSHVYKEVEYNRRTYSDLREELVTRLVSLPRFEAIVPLNNGQVVQFATTAPLLIAADIEPKANAVRERSRRELGHPWQEVVKDIQTRQSVPPGKPQI